MVKPILYGVEASPPVRSVLLTAKVIGLELDIRSVNVFIGEHIQDLEFLKKNPQRTIPLLDDNGKYIWDSHAIVTYLIGKYAKNDELYPKDLYERALIDQRLHFDSGILFPRLRAISELLFIKKIPNIPEENISVLYGGCDFVEKFLENNLYMIGNSLTVADICCVTSISSMQILAPITEDRYPKVSAWLKRMTQLPYYKEINEKGVKELENIFQTRIKSLQGQ